MRLTTFGKLGEHKNAPRLWVESGRLARLGFAPGTGLEIEQSAARVILRAVAGVTGNRVSSKRDAGGVRPLIDICSNAALGGLAGYPEIKLVASTGRIDITPSVRGFTIARRLAERKLTAVEFFCGGGLLSQAVAPHFAIRAGVEVNPDYADVWAETHPEAELFQTDVRSIHPRELPEFDVLIAGIPCTSHSNAGRAKNKLAGKPELGETGDLYISVLTAMEVHLPLAAVFENVPNFGASLAGLTLKARLSKMGYAVAEMILDPHGAFGEPQDRKRWVCVATLEPGFAIQTPGTAYDCDLTMYLDAPSAADEADAARIAGTIAGLTTRMAEQRAKGNGFGFTTISRQSRKVPTLMKSYAKINSGPFVETQFGLRLLRQHEFEKLMGSAPILSGHFATATEILGQGVQPRVFGNILGQLRTFLTNG